MSTKQNNLSPRLQKWKNTGSTSICSGHEMFYRDSGTGSKTIVCIHGFPTSSFDWEEMWPSLESEYRVFAPDLLGFGFSDKPSSYEYTISEQANLISELLIQRGIKRFHLLSHDYGTIVAQELLARCNTKGQSPHFSIESTTFLNGALFPEMHRPRLTQKLLLSPIGPIISKLFNEKKFSKAFLDVFGNNTQPTPFEVKECWSLICYKCGNKITHLLMNYFRERKVFRDRWVHAIQNTSVPISIINGLEDPVSGRHLVERARKDLPKAKIFELENIGHYPQVEAPEAVLKAFLGFLSVLEKNEK